LTLTGWDSRSGEITDFDKSDGVNYSVSRQLTASSLEKALEAAQSELQKYKDANPTLKQFYETEIARLQNEMLAKGLVESVVVVPVSFGSDILNNPTITRDDEGDWGKMDSRRGCGFKLRGST